MVLAEYPMQSIIDAITQYIRQRPDMPRPADIEAILNPPPAKPDWAVYVALHKKAASGRWLYSDEREYLAYCDRYAIEHVREQQNDHQEAKKQIEQFRALSYDHE